MADFVIADPHWGHDNIIRYCNRPFGSVEEMDAELIRRHNAVVGLRDTVFWGGDMFFCGLERAREIKAQLHGAQHVCVLGNHDKASFLEKLGFHVYRRSVLLDICEGLGTDYAYLWHKPRQDAALPGGNGRTRYWQLYGHLHNREHVVPQYGLCVSAERLDYTPITVQEALARLQAAWPDREAQERAARENQRRG